MDEKEILEVTGSLIYFGQLMQVFGLQVECSVKNGKQLDPNMINGLKQLKEMAKEISRDFNPEKLFGEEE